MNSTLIKSTAVGALGGLLFGFDTAVISGATHSLTNTFHLSAGQLGFTVSSALLGTVLGAIFAGIPGERLGGRNALIIMAGFYLVSSLGCAVASDWSTLIFFRFLGGIGIGGSSVLGPVYISEISPPKFRGRLVGTFQINIVVGILLAYLSNATVSSFHLGIYEWRWELCVPALPALIFLITLFGIPQSARWLVTKGRVAEARRVIESLGVKNVEAELQEILDSIDVSRALKAEPLFKLKYKRSIFLALTIGMFNQLSGINAILYYLNDIFAQAGFSSMSANLQAVTIGIMNLIATLLAMAVIDRVGRKALLLWGAAGAAVCLASVAEIFASHSHEQSLVWILTAYIFFFATSQGAVIWVYISEVFPNKVRAKGQSLGCSAHWIMNATIAGIFPLMAEKSGAYPFAFFSAMMILQFVTVLFFYPETKGVSLEQMQRVLESQ